MPRYPRKFNGLARVAVIGGAVVALSTGGLVLMSHAQDKPADAPATPNQPVAYQALKADAVNGVDAATLVQAQPAGKAQTAGRPFRGDLIRGKPIQFRRPLPPAKVQWAAAMGQVNAMRPHRKNGGLWSRLPKADLDRTRLPVILPRDGGFIQTAKAKMVSFGDAYALNMPQDKGVQIVMYGNRSFVPADKGDISSRPVQKLAGVAEDIRIGQTEDGWTATFSRYGVVYSVDISCDDINSDDCKTDTYIRNAIAQFDDVTMGSEATAEAQADGQSSSSSSPAGWLDQVSQTIKNLTKGN